MKIEFFVSYFLIIPSHRIEDTLDKTFDKTLSIYEEKFIALTYSSTSIGEIIVRQINTITTSLMMWI